MASENLVPFVLDESTGKRWYFYLSPNKRIKYTCKENEEWTKSLSLCKETVKSFSATIDIDNKIYIVAYTLTRQLIYYEWNGNQWLHKILYRAYSRFQDVSFLSVISTKSLIHIFYYIQNSLQRNQEPFIHYYWNGMEWSGKTLWSFYSDDLISPQIAFADTQDNVHILFSKRYKKNHQLFYSQFESSSLSWNAPIMIHQGDSRYLEPYFYIDQKQNMHFIWKRIKDEKTEICYIHSNGNDTSKVSWDQENVLYMTKGEIEHPVLAWITDLYCSWRENDINYFILSKNFGYSWEEPQLIRDNLHAETAYYTFTSFEHKEIPPTMGQWGKVYPYIEPLVMEASLTLEGDNPSMETRVGQSQPSISQLEKQIKEIYSFVCTLQERFIEKEKTIYQLQTSVKKLSFEIEQLRGKRYKSYSNIPNQSVKRTNYQSVLTDIIKQDTEKTDAKDASGESEKIYIGNTSIIINADEEEGDMD